MRLPLILAAAIVATPAWALDQSHSITLGTCGAGGAMNFHWAVAEAASRPIDLLRQGTSPDSPQNTQTIQTIPLRFMGSGQSGEARREPPTARPSANPAPEPGIWVVLIAGFLAMCAVARRRLFSS